MNVKISAEFESAYLADRAYARIKAAGVAAMGQQRRQRQEREPGLFIAYPYPRQEHSYYNNLSFGLPETTGVSIRMDTSILGGFGDSGGKGDAVRLEVIVDEKQLGQVRGILVNSGARGIVC